MYGGIDFYNLSERPFNYEQSNLAQQFNDAKAKGDKWAMEHVQRIAEPRIARIKALPPKPRNMLKVIHSLVDKKTYITRSMIAIGLKRPTKRLYRYDIEVLKMLQSQGFVVCHRRPVWRGGLAAGSEYVYTIEPTLAWIIKRITK